jgi:Cu/Ag efflux pump CusA
MMRWIVRSSLRARKAVVAAAAVIFAVGVWQLRDAQMDTLPEFGPTTVEVQTEALGLSAEEMEQLITAPLEQDLLNGVAWMESIRSQSVPGLSNIVMEFEPGTDLYRARQVVQERLNEAHALPNVAKVPAMLQPQSSTSRVMMISLSSEELSPIELGVLARWTIVPRLTGAPGVSNVVIWGQKERQLQVLVDPRRLADAGVTLDEVVRTTGNALWASPLTFLEASTPGTGGFIDQNNQRLGVQHLSPIKTAADLARVVLDRSERTSPTPAAPLRLGDVADVVEDHQPLIGDAVVSGGEGLLLVVEKLPGTSTSDVTSAVEDALDALRPGLDGVDIDTGIYRPATYLEHASDNLTRAAILGAVLALLGLVAFLFSWRRVLISAVAIVVSLVAAALVLYLRDSTFNAVVIAGLVMALAAVVDDAVVSVDDAARRLRTADGTRGAGDTAAAGAGAARPASAAELIGDAALGVGRSLGFALAVMVVALIPVFVLEGLAGESFYPPLAISFLIAVVVSFLVAMTLTPVLSLLLLPKSTAVESESPVVRGLQSLYRRALQPLSRRAIPAALLGAAAIVIGALAYTHLDRALVPALKETDLLVSWNGPPGASLPEMDRITTRAAEELRGLRGVRDVDAHVGRAVRGDLVGGANEGEIWISLDPDTDYERTVGAIEEVVNGYPGLERKVVTYSQNRITDVLATEQAPIRVRLYGQDLEVLEEKGAQLGQLLSEVDGAEDVRVQQIVTEPTIEIEVDLGKAQEAGIKPGDVRRAATTLVSGIQVGALFEAQKIFEVQVWGVPEVRRNASDIEGLLLDLPEGGHVTLGEVADVRIGSSPSSIEHDATSRSLDVTAAVGGRPRSDVVGDLRAQLAEVGFPLEYHAEVLGDYTDRTGAERKVTIFALGAALGVFLLLQAVFSSWRLALLAFASLVAAVSGGFIAAWLDGGTMTLATVAGVLAVLAVATRQIVMLIGRYQHLEELVGAAHGRAVVEVGSADGLGAVVTSVGVTALALLPVIVAGSIAGQEIVRPMAVVIIGGLITTSIVTLFVLPALYVHLPPPRAPAEARSFMSSSLAAEPETSPAMVPEPVASMRLTRSWPTPPSPTSPEG